MATLGGLFRGVLSLMVLSSLATGFVFGQETSKPLRKGSGQRYAILIGVDDYNELEDLQYCGADQLAFRDELLKAGFPADNIFLLHTKATETKFVPLKANIEKQLDIVLNHLVERDDLLVFGFSGHGAHLDGKSYLLPAEANVERLDSLISRDLVYQKLQDCPASLKVAFIDACRDDPRPAGRRSSRTASDPKALAQSLEKVPEGLLLFTSCAPGEISMEEKKFGHGVFMHFVLEGMQGSADADGNRSVSFKELFKYAGQKTKLYVAREFNGYQTPRKTSAEEDAEVEDFALVKLDGQSAAVIPLPLLKPEPSREPLRLDTTKHGEVITNSVGMKLIGVRSGNFTMGSPTDEAGRQADELQLEAKITNGFYMGVTEVTQEQWKSVMGTEPWKGESLLEEGHDYPTTHVSWDDAVAFCRKLSEKEGKAYRLPNEAEWEYACRGGSTGVYGFDSNVWKLSQYGWIDENTMERNEFYAHRVRLKRPNAFGLYDMHGNVSEWCSFWYGDSTLDGSEVKGLSKDLEKGASTLFQVLTGATRLSRGGCWSDAAVECRSAKRSWNSKDLRWGRTGFRVLLSSDARSIPKPSRPTAPPIFNFADSAQSQATALAAQQAWADHVGQELTIMNTIGMQLRLLPPGEFMMGSTESKEDLESMGISTYEGFSNVDEQPQHRVQITKPIYVGTYEVTLGQFLKYYNADKEKHKTDAEKDGMGGFGFDGEKFEQKPSYVAWNTGWNNPVNDYMDHPVVNVSWNDAVSFCKWLTEKERFAGQIRADQEYRLLDEAQWEYASRSGNPGLFGFGNNSNELTKYGNVKDSKFGEEFGNKLGDQLPGSDGYVFTSPVGKYLANGFGLYDMYGNVWEWCADGYDASTYGTRRATVKDPFVKEGAYRVNRGGGWYFGPVFCRSAFRFRYAPDIRHFFLGFRVSLQSVR